jgi:hypothetical protein
MVEAGTDPKDIYGMSDIWLESWRLAPNLINCGHSIQLFGMFQDFSRYGFSQQLPARCLRKRGRSAPKDFQRILREAATER